LHSSKLELLGVTRSIASCCAEFAKQEHIQVDFGHRDVPKSIPPEIGLCLFRIVQEGLRNVSKHSHASKVEVQLTGKGNEISLSLCDNGIGFEPSRTSASNGIGVQSMNERARMVGGWFELRASPMTGTQITVKVPLEKPFRAV
jgi:signal transduction histidine kinase